jgi:undecaprenyl-diphosphatase
MKHPAAQLAVGFLALVLLGWGIGELWLSIVGSADLDGVRNLARQRSATLNDVARVVTWAGSAWVLVPLGAICCLAFVRAGLHRQALAIALSFGGAWLLWVLVKLLVARPRPPVEHLQTVSGSSFPSGHATQASAFWLALVLALRSAGVSDAAGAVVSAIALTLLVAVAASRVYLGVHYPGDVIAGALLGAAWATLVSRRLREIGTR